MNRYVEAAQRYAQQVQAGDVPTCKWTRLAVDRQVDDLAREPSEQWPWVFDEERAARICAFLELLPHIKGKWARQGKLLVPVIDLIFRPWMTEHCRKSWVWQRHLYE